MTTTTTTSTATTAAPAPTTYWWWIGWGLFWVSGGILVLMVVPATENPAAIPAALFAVVVLALASGLWGKTFIGRKTIVAVASVVLVLTCLSFFFISLFPKTAESAPKLLDTVDTKMTVSLEDFMSDDDKATAATTETTATPAPPATTSDAFVPAAPKFPVSGQAFLEKGVEVKAWLHPSNLHTEGSAPVTYELEDHPSFRFQDDFSRRNDRKFRKFPAGNYIVTTESTEEVHFLWRPKH